MSGIMTIMQMTASIMSDEQIIEQLQERLDEYKSAVLDSEKKYAKSGLTVMCMMQVFKDFNKEKDIFKILEESEKIEKMVNIFNPGKQQQKKEGYSNW